MQVRPADRALSALPPWITTVNVAVTYGQDVWEASYDVAASSFTGKCPAPVYYLDAAASTEELIRRVREDDNPMISSEYRSGRA